MMIHDLDVGSIQFWDSKMLDYERINILRGVCMVFLTVFAALFDGFSFWVLLFSSSNTNAEILIVNSKFVLPLNWYLGSRHTPKSTESLPL